MNAGQMHQRLWVGVIVCAALGCADASAPGPMSGPDAADDAEATTSLGDNATPSNWDSCNAPGDCVIVPRSCCSGFYVPGNYAAIHRAKMAAWKQNECPNPTAYSCDAALITNHRLLAFCLAGRCEQIVVPEDPISACSTADECVVVAEKADTPLRCGSVVSPSFAIRADQLATYAAQVCPTCTPADLVCPSLGDGGARDSGLPEVRCAAGHCRHTSD